ncbi:hypothetical protein HG535_0A07990 [Zygotorulaspora mrakii]|uniref:Guanine-nucleotide exchange factor YEL1 n=1 Tax=Zygotorulaspora mrakii TaxID=42260 RepID=A0A7H9AXM2_ZYGMR|nr:uncharacterized protein HG535_0A07990 [Zygotorulaspora mrakii]QLG70854.1 hypothetical protein HG535_0A07990 [Zygotorulaspora mrakii]
MSKEVIEEENHLTVTPDRRNVSELSGAPSSPLMIESPKMVNIHQFMTDQLDDSEVESQMPSLKNSDMMIAAEIIQGTYDAIDFKAYANFMGAQHNSQILTAFISMLKPFPNSLLLSLRALVSKIYFIAEAQNIDRILEELSKQWVDHCNSPVWHNHYKLCHIVLFSLLILNSDLHNDENSRINIPKFTCNNFVENTLFALRKEARVNNYSIEEEEPLIMEELTSYYSSLRTEALQLLIKLSSKLASKHNSRLLLRTESKLSNGGRQLGKRNSKFSLRSETLTPVDSSSSSTYNSLYSESTLALKHESHFTSNWRFHHNEPLSKLYRYEPDIDKVLSKKNGSLFYMDYSIKISDKDMSQSGNTNEKPQATNDKHGNGRLDLFRWLKKTKNITNFREKKSVAAFLEDNTKWVHARVRVFEGRIYIFKLKDSSRIPENATMEYLKKQSPKYIVFNLVEALAFVVQDNIVQCSQNKNLGTQHEHVSGNFTLTIPTRLYQEKVVLEFQTSTLRQAEMYVNSINFWAARQAPVPKAQFELVSNEEYGWSDKLFTSNYDVEKLDSMYLSAWKPLLSIGALYEALYGDMTEEDQLELFSKISELETFAEEIQFRIDRHNNNKSRAIALWRDSKQFDAVMSNWNTKYLYLNTINERNKAYLKSLRMVRTELGEDT